MANPFGTFKTKATTKNTQPSKKAFLVITQQIVTPRDGSAQSLLAGRCIAWASNEK